MKKTLVALCVAAGMVGTASAADVQLYGLINTGLGYVHTHSDVAGVANTDTLSMDNGQEFGSRWGLRGGENLGNGYKVSFVLESGFESDTGLSDTKQNGRLFGREASISVSGGFGTLSFGRLPIFGSVLGANGLFRAIDPLFANYTSAFGSGAATASMWTRTDNSISYRTPTYAGLTGYAMYSFKMNTATDTGTEGKSSSDRYASLAARYQNGGLEGILVADTTMYGSYRTGTDIPDQGYTVTLGGNYGFNNGFKIIAFGQYFHDQELTARARAGVGYASLNAITGGKGYGYVDGWGIGVGAHYPVLGGTAKVAVNYRDMDNQNNTDFNRWTAAVGYDYPLSKRTSLYAMAGYSSEKVKTPTGSATPTGCELDMGILHRF